MTTVDKNQTTGKNIHFLSGQPAVRNEINANSPGSLKKDRIFLSKVLTALLLNLNKDVSDPNKASSVQTMVVKDESNLFGA